MFELIVTDTGTQKLAQYISNLQPLPLASIVVGNGGGVPVTLPLNPAITAVVSEVYRTSIQVRTVQGSVSSFSITIPANVGGFTIREAGLVDLDGDLFAYANLPEVYKPTEAEGQIFEFPVTLRVAFSNAADVTVTVDPSAALATQQFVVDQVNTRAPTAHSHAWADLTDPPATYAPSAHGHSFQDVSGVPDTLGEDYLFFIGG